MSTDRTSGPQSTSLVSLCYCDTVKTRECHRGDPNVWLDFTQTVFGNDQHVVRPNIEILPDAFSLLKFLVLMTLTSAISAFTLRTRTT